MCQPIATFYIHQLILVYAIQASYDSLLLRFERLTSL